ncbi:MAG TPA: NADH-quinone oxidoreductase subunit J [Acidobacteriaceae bacterium]|nr:NADH-quinone oxidoreductase subunit J [Acidobacteriaceae bacterium]
MSIIFLILAAITITGASAAMGLRNLIHCVLALTLGFVGLAMLYLELGAQFVGFTQILVYVGAVAILSVFAIMMTRSAGPDAEAEAALSASWISGLVVAGATFAVLAWAIITSNITAAASAQPEVSVKDIGNALMHNYAVPLEIMGLLLTAALIGAVIVAMPQEKAP